MSMTPKARHPVWNTVKPFSALTWALAALAIASYTTVLLFLNLAHWKTDVSDPGGIVIHGLFSLFRQGNANFSFRLLFIRGNFATILHLYNARRYWIGAINPQLHYSHNFLGVVQLVHSSGIPLQLESKPLATRDRIAGSFTTGESLIFLISQYDRWLT